ncbi:subtilisin [Pedobacter cryoconitis]|uniref:Subtilisin n=1 Tax=Pedobacter cryoconitis TaxID=188932 RepID=A0A7W9E0K8_9SPHI|nr:S8 family serine peptidase [Pedobacter cryoconitis]MBB5638166.1 subtilisin [Pedobacter cryoconitis]
MKKNNTASKNYILLPVFRTNISKQESPNVARFLTMLSNSVEQASAVSLASRNMHQKASDDIPVVVLDSIEAEGAKLIRINADELANFRFSYPGLRLIKEKFYKPAVCSPQRIQVQIEQAEIKTAVTVNITDTKGIAVADVTVVIFTDFQGRKGASGVTDLKGSIALSLDRNTAERIYIYPNHSYWGYFNKAVQLTAALNIQLEPIVLSFKDSLRYFYDTAKFPKITQKVRIGIIDTGVGPHQDLKVAGGKNLVRGENETDYQDNGEGHGTHVGGIIGAYGQLNGVAAGVEIMSYRVFPKDSGASNFDIMKAINEAITDQCDLINMSLGESQVDEGITSYIKEAYNAGIVCFAANGNDNRAAVSFPANDSLSIAVSAMGRLNTFPPNSVESGSVEEPYGTDKDNFIADFSNIGPETALTAPGVGIISTYPNNLYAVMDGTSMACPAATGMAARILAGNPELLNLPRNQTRADEIVKYLSVNIKSMGFGNLYEGKGMLQPPASK